MINAQEYWNDRYKSGRNSGNGSYGEILQKKLQLLKGLDIQSITEIGCGDFNFGSNLLKMYPVKYNGYDISDVIIEKNKREYPQYNFNTMNSLVSTADLALCVDTLFHILDDDEYESTLDLLGKLFTNYLAITTYEEAQEVPSQHLKIRKFDYKRFGEPIIREPIGDSGKLYFYLYKKQAYDINRVSACLITKEPIYPKEVLDNIQAQGFGEILILTNSDSPYRKYELFNKAKYDDLYYQDDDAIVPIKELFNKAKANIINVGMKPGHIEAYKDNKMTMGLGWGALFNKSILNTLGQYKAIYGEDEVLKREAERILTYLNFPQNRISLDIIDLPSAWAEDRLWRQPQHQEFANLVEERCKTLV